MSEYQEPDPQRLHTEKQIIEDQKLIRSIISLVLIGGTIYHFLPENHKIQTPNPETESKNIKQEKIITDPNPQKATFDIINQLG
jgi:hypothetical protein